MAGPADLHLFVGSWKMGGIAYVYDLQERFYDPPECHPGQQAYTSDSYPVDVFHLSFNFLCLLLL